MWKSHFVNARTTAFCHATQVSSPPKIRRRQLAFRIEGLHAPILHLIEYSFRLIEVSAYVMIWIGSSCKLIDQNVDLLLLSMN